MAGRPYKCPKCSSTNTTWKGYRLLSEGRVRLRKCQTCGRKFTTRQRIKDQSAGGGRR